MLDRVKDRFDLQPERLISDTAYGYAMNLGWLVEHGIAPHIAVIDQSGYKDGIWSRADFEWDAENNKYICLEGEPAQAVLTQLFRPKPWFISQRCREIPSSKTRMSGLFLQIKVLPQKPIPARSPMKKTKTPAR